jgi:SAM-dependent methyltransferase
METSPVETLYRDYPYPGHGVVSSVVARLLGPTLDRLRIQAGDRRLRVLDAGCGTGEQALGIARTFPDVEVHGIDFSAASLEMAERLSREKGIPVTFARKDLTASLADLGRFDVIVSIGVLHHLPEPKVGFSRLREIVAPGGVFLGMVYGKFGKWQTFQLRDALKLLQKDAGRDELLKFLGDSGFAGNTGPLHYLETLVRRVKFGPSIPFGEAVRRTLSGRSNAYQADTFTHVQEAVYTWSEVIDLLAATGWNFEGWPRNSGMPDEPSQLFKGQALVAAERLSPLERANIYERILRPLCLYFLATPKTSP